VHTLEGPVLEGATVLVRDGRITAVGVDLAVPPDAEVLDATGLEVVPGFVDALGVMGLKEIDQVDATVDTTELGDFNPQLRAATAYNPQSELIPVARAAGITSACAAPGPNGGSVLPGKAGVFHLDGRTLAEAALAPSVAMVLDWPEARTRTWDMATCHLNIRPFAEARKEQEHRLQELSVLFGKARHYALALEGAGSAGVPRDLRLEALVPVVRGRMPLMVAANRARDIRQAIAFCDREHAAMILCGGAEAWQVKDLLKAKGIPVILDRTLNLPPTEDDPYDRAMTLPAELRKAGIPVAIAVAEPSQARQLPQQAGVAAAYGLAREEALEAITLTPARILGLDKDIGSIKAGKLADLVLTDGDPLELRTQVVRVFINGRPVSLENRNHLLFEKFKDLAAPHGK
jgi:imidazolonepropionase-like amidohydrolase